MNLLTKEIEKKLPALYSQENTPLDEQVAVVKFFDPMSRWNWYAIEYSPAERLFFGWVQGFKGEYGYFSLDELESLGKKRVLGIERDISFRPTKMKELTKGK